MAATDFAYTISGGVVKGCASEALVRRGRNQFNIVVRHKDVQGTTFGDQYFSIVEASTDKEIGCVWPGKPLKYICDYCLPLLKQLAPQMSLDGLTLEDLTDAPYYDLEIVKGDGPIETRISGEDRCSYKPTLFIAPLAVTDLPAECRPIPRIVAAQISLDGGDPRIGIQGRLPVAGRQDVYFKPRELGREKEFDRELRILNEIKKKCLLQGEIRLSNLQGIVVSGGSEAMCVGLLLDIIPAPSLGIEGSLLGPTRWTDITLHEKWERQVTATVEALHAHDIVWGDVNGGNVVIDEDSNAWVIDFGGRNNPEFVDDDKAETMDGDWQGVKRLFQVWLVERRAGVPL